MAQIWIDGKQWLTTDYLTVNKDLHVKGDFIVDGQGAQAYDTILTGSLRVSGTAVVSKLAAGTYHIPAGIQHYLKGTTYLTKAYGTHYGKFYGTWTGSLGSVTSLTVDKLTAGSFTAGTIRARNVYGTHHGRGYGTYYGQFQGTLTGYIGSVTTLTTDKLTAGSATIGTLQARFAGLGTKPGGYTLRMKSGSVSYVDSLGSTVFAMFKGSAQARIGMGRNVYLGSMVDAFHVWSTGAELRLRQSYSQVTRLWIDQAVLNVSKGNFGSPFPAALSITPGSSNKVGLEIYGTKSQSANFLKIYRNSAGTLVLTSGTKYSLRTYGTARMNKFEGSYKRLVQGGSAAPGSAGYITFGRAFAAPPMAVLTQKDPWVPSVAKGPRIKRTAAGSMMAFGPPGSYMWWQATGSAF